MEKHIKIISAFLYFTIIIFPSVIELILLTNLNVTEIPALVLICGFVQSIFSMMGGILLGNSFDQHSDIVWCGNITDYKSMLTGGYIIYCLSGWTIINIFGSLFSGFLMHWYIYLMIFMPILIFVPFFSVGYALNKHKNDLKYAINKKNLIDPI